MALAAMDFSPDMLVKDGDGAERSPRRNRFTALAPSSGGQGNLDRWGWRAPLLVMHDKIDAELKAYADVVTTCRVRVCYAKADGCKLEVGAGRLGQPLLARMRAAWAADTRYRIVVGAPPRGAAERDVGPELDRVRRLLKKQYV